MPRAGLADRSRELLMAGLADPDVIARYESKLRIIDGSSCLWWRGSVSGRGHGRFWVGAQAGRDVVVIAHRFSYAMAHGLSALEAVPVLGHRCDNPLCQRTGVGHVEISTASRNRREWAMRRHTVGGVLRDTRGARGRAVELRNAVRDDPCARTLTQAMNAGLIWDQAQLPLWSSEKVSAVLSR